MFRKLLRNLEGCKVCITKIHKFVKIRFPCNFTEKKLSEDLFHGNVNSSSILLSSYAFVQSQPQHYGL